MSFLGRITIRAGRLVTYYEPHDMPGASIRVETQCYDEAHRPAVGNFSGPGLVTDDRRVILGDPWRSSTLTEYTLAPDPHPDSDLYDEGYRRGWRATREPRGWQSWPEARLDGWRDGRQHRRAAS